MMTSTYSGPTRCSRGTRVAGDVVEDAAKALLELPTFDAFAQRLVNTWATFAVPTSSGSWVRAQNTDGEPVPLTQHRLAEHLAGGPPVGLYEKDADGLSRWGVLDADRSGQGHAIALRAAQGEAARDGVPILLERSRGGRLHGWLWTSDPTPTENVAILLRYYAGREGAQLEVFPKSAASSPVGNLVRAPGGRHHRNSVVYGFEEQTDITPAGFAEFIGGAPTITPDEIERLLARHEERIKALEAEEATATERRGGLLATIHSKLNPVTVLGWFGITPDRYDERKGTLSLRCPFHDDDLSFSAWRTGDGRWRWKCQSTRCPTQSQYPRGLKSFDFVDFVALKLHIGVPEAIGWIARELGIPTDGEPRQILPGTPDADGYTCEAFQREGWQGVLPERVAAGYQIIAHEERRRGLPPFGIRTATSVREDVLKRVKDGLLPDARPWLPLSYRQFAKRLTGNSRHLRTALRVYSALEAASLIELQRGMRRRIGAPPRATCVLRVWPVPSIPSPAQLREFMTPWRGTADRPTMRPLRRAYSGQ